MYGEDPNFERGTYRIIDALSRPSLSFCETWQDEAGISASDWTVTDPATGAAWARGASGAYLRATSAPNANEVCRLISDIRWIFAPDTYGTNTIQRAIFLEFELKLTNVANIDNTASFFGLTAGAADDRTTNEIIGFGLNTDVLESVTDDGGAETTTTNFDETLTNWNKLAIVATFGHVYFFVNEFMKADHSTNLPDNPYYIDFYVDTEAGGAATIELGTIRVGWYDRSIL